MELAPVKQAFGSPGGKTKLAPRIVGMIPPHRIYVEPFAGGAAVYFKKGASPEEVLNDKDAKISFMFSFLRDMTPTQFERLKRMNWVSSRKQFEKLKGMKPKDEVEKFYQMYYIRWASFGKGSTTYSPGGEGMKKDVGSLWRVHERLGRTRVYNTTALKMIDKFDSPNTFFYLDPPYPDRAFIGSTFGKYTMEDLKQLTDRLGNIKGKFLLSLSTEHQKLLPPKWMVRRLKLRRSMQVGGEDWNKGFQYEIVAGNYNIDKPEKVRVPQGLMARAQPRRQGKQRLYRRTRRGYVPPTVSLARMAG